MINTPVTDGKRRRTGWSPDGKKYARTAMNPLVQIISTDIVLTVAIADLISRDDSDNAEKSEILISTAYGDVSRN